MFSPQFPEGSLALEGIVDIAMADTEVAPPALIEDSPLCFACAKPGVMKCGGCDNARYSSTTCQNCGWKTHKLLCEAFPLFEPRPSPSHHRCILFPDSEFKPRFVWIGFGNDRPAFSKLNEFIITRYLACNKFDRFRKLNRAMGCIDSAFPTERVLSRTPYREISVCPD
jgi:hypothetical protein